MNKLKYDIIRRIYDDTSLTSDELNMIIYLAKRSDELGCVDGIYYKEVAEELSICHSQFYNIIKSLCEKEYISKNKEHHQDINITLEGNSFVEPDADLKPIIVYKNYLNLNMSIFDNPRFYKLKVGAKKLLLAIIVKTVNDRARRKKQGRKTYAKVFHVPLKEYTIYAEKLHISRRMVKEYFKDIREWVSVYNDIAFTEKHILSVSESALAKADIVINERHKSVVKKIPENLESDIHYIRMQCRRQKVETENDVLIDTAMLLTQFRKKAMELKQNIRSIALKALQNIGSTLNAAAMNKYISNYIANGEKKKDDIELERALLSR